MRKLLLFLLLPYLQLQGQDIHPEEIYRRMPAPKPIPWIVDYQKVGKCIKLVVSHEPSFGPTSLPGPKIITLDHWTLRGGEESASKLSDIVLHFYSGSVQMSSLQIPTPIVAWPKLPDGVSKIRVTLWAGKVVLCSEEFEVK